MHVTAGDAMSEARLAVLSAVIDGDAGLAFRIVSDLMSDGCSFESVLFDVLAPLQQDVGRRWQHGDLGISEEHAATGAVETVVSLLAGSFMQPDEGEHVVVVCAEGDNHSLPARMVAAYLIYLGWRVTFLGASVPADDLASFLIDTTPDALMLSCGIATTLPGARASIRSAHAAGVPVVAGGRGFGKDPTWAQALGADAWMDDPLRLDDLLRTWDPDPASAEAAALDPDDEYHALAAARHSVLAEAAALALEWVAQPSGAEATNGRHRHRVAGDLRILFDTLLAALLLRDAGPLHEFTQWHLEFDVPPHSQRTTTPQILHGLRDATRGVSPLGSRYLDEAMSTLRT